MRRGDSGGSGNAWKEVAIFGKIGTLQRDLSRTALPRNSEIQEFHNSRDVREDRETADKIGRDMENPHSYGDVCIGGYHGGHLRVIE